jgi:hypothetical protein
MKIELHEYEGCFSFDLTAESVADAALIARLAVNATKDVRGCSAHASEDGEFTGAFTVGKRKESTGSIPKL